MQAGTWSPLIPGAFDPATHGLEGWPLFSRYVYFNLEKLRATWTKGPVSVSIGDVYASFGRGLALQANRNVEIDIDTSIQGLQVKWQPGLWDLQALFGQLNRQQVFQDNPNLGLFGDRRHTVGALRVERYGLGP